MTFLSEQVQHLQSAAALSQLPEQKHVVGEGNQGESLNGPAGGCRDSTWGSTNPQYKCSQPGTAGELTEAWEHPSITTPGREFVAGRNRILHTGCNPLQQHELDEAH